jgi:hypothetical protein
MHSEQTGDSSSHCAHCGAPRESQARYCRHCGSQYGTTPEQAPSESAASEVTSPREGGDGDRTSQPEPGHAQGPMAAPQPAGQAPSGYSAQPPAYNPSPPPGYQPPYNPPPPGYQPPYAPPVSMQGGPPTELIPHTERRGGKSTGVLAGLVLLAVIAVVGSVTAIYFAVSHGSGSTASVLPAPTIVSSSPAPSASAPAPTRSASAPAPTRPSSAPAPTATPSLPTNAAPASFLGAGVTGRDASGYNTGPSCSDNPSSSLPGCRDSPSTPNGVDRSCPSGITVDAQSTTCGLATSVRANYRGDGLVTGYSPERGSSYTFSCYTGGPGTTGYTICIGHAGSSELYVRWKQ